jgi:hypothetical protein
MPIGLVEKFCDTYGEANIGTTTGGVVGLLLVDVDSMDESLWTSCVERFGDTPAKVRTASGKLHLWYRSPGSVRNAQRLDGLPIDIRGDGGFAVLPPSVRTGLGAYSWIEGGLHVLGQLPEPKAGSLPNPRRPAASLMPTAPSTVGQRNSDLFAFLRLQALDLSSQAEMLDVARAWNAKLDEPLPDSEVQRVAGSVWGYKATGRLLPPGGSAILIPRRAIDEIAIDNPDSFVLLSFLRMHHAGLRESFIVSVRALAKRFGWWERRVRRARDRLVERHYLVTVQPGGRWPGDAARFSFGSTDPTEARRAGGGGALRHTNTNLHSSPPFFDDSGGRT